MTEFRCPFAPRTPRSSAADALPAIAGRPKDLPSQTHLGRGAQYHESDADPHGGSVHPRRARGPDPFRSLPRTWPEPALQRDRQPLPSAVQPEDTQNGTLAAAPSSFRAGDMLSLPLNYYLVQRASRNTAGYNSRLPRVSVSPLPGHDKLPPKKTLDFTNKRGMSMASCPLYRCCPRSTKGRSG